MIWIWGICLSLIVWGCSMADDYAFINMISGIFTAFGTVGATWLAAWSIYQTKRINVEIYIGAQLTLQGEEKKSIVCFNRGPTPVEITNYVIEIGFFKKSIYIIENDDPNTIKSTLPHLIITGDASNIIFKPKALERKIVMLATQHIMIGNSKFNAKFSKVTHSEKYMALLLATCRICAYSPSGGKASAPLDAPLRKYVFDIIINNIINKP